MKKISIVLLFALLLISCSSVKETGKYKVNVESNFFWKAKSSTATVYLLGSIHVAKEEMYPLPKIIEDSFDSSQALVVEIDLNQVDPFELMQKAMYSDGRTLESELKPETFLLLDSLLKEHQIPEMIYSKMKPWLAVVTVLTMDLAKGGYDENIGIDKYFLEKAQDKKEILELESAEMQMNLFNTELENLQDEFVKFSLMDSDNMISQVDTLVSYWKTGNIEAMEKLILAQYIDYPEFKPLMDKLYTQRNLRMTEKIEGFLSTNKVYFVVVGAAHVIGEKGIIRLLSEK